MKFTKARAAACAIVLSALAGCASQTTPETSEPAQPAATPAPQPAQPVAVSHSAPQSAPAAAATTDPRSAQRIDYYDFDRSEIKPEYRPIVESQARSLRQNPQAMMTVQGHGDERGSREYNLALGQRRSEGVKHMLVLEGVQESRIEALTCGEEKPVALGHDEASWSQNRRSEMVYDKK